MIKFKQLKSLTFPFLSALLPLVKGNSLNAKKWRKNLTNNFPLTSLTYYQTENLQILGIFQVTIKPMITTFSPNTKRRNLSIINQWQQQLKNKIPGIFLKRTWKKTRTYKINDDVKAKIS